MYDEQDTYDLGYRRGFWNGLIAGMFVMLTVFTIAGLWITS